MNREHVTPAPALGCKECYFVDGEGYTDCERGYSCPLGEDVSEKKTKGECIGYGVEKIKDVLKFLQPEKTWEIQYARLEYPNEIFDEWTINHHGLIAGEEYILVFGDPYMSHLLYAINVTGDSVLCALSELMQLLVNKF